MFFLIVKSYFFGQSFSTSPISYYGIGEKSWQSQAIYSSLGYSGISVFDSTQLNIQNPASYSYLSKGNTLFSLGMGGKITNFSDQQGSVIRSQYLVDQYALGFKMKKKLGLAFGLRPYANRNYQVTDYEFTGVDSLRYSYIGKGGFSEVLIGTSYRPLNTRIIKFSVGGNIGYVFGANEKIRRAHLMVSNSDYPFGEQNTLMRINSLSLYTSAILELNLSKNNQITLTAAYEPSTYASKLRTINSISNVTLGTNGRPSYDVISADTMDYEYVSESFSLGLSYKIGLPKWRIQTRELHPSLSIISSFKSTSSTILDLDTTNSFVWSTGLQFNPERDLFENLSILKFPEKLSYRIGGYFSNFQFYDQSVNDFGTTFGIGLPILIQQSLSSVNFSFQIGKRMNDSESINELYGGMQVGLIFCPSSFDRWFRKRKLD